VATFVALVHNELTTQVFEEYERSQLEDEELGQPFGAVAQLAFHALKSGEASYQKLCEAVAGLRDA
jgi:hypothetical protein